MDSGHFLHYAINTNPIRIELELTERCNLSCKFCYNSQKPVDSSLVREILCRLFQEHVPEIVLTGGEPLLHKDFDDILRLSSEMFQKVMIQTNGTLIDNRKAGLITDNNVYEVNISLHGPARLNDSLTMREGSHDEAVEAIKRLLHCGVRVSSNFVMTKENIDGLDDNLEELYCLGVRNMTLTRFTPTGIGAANEGLLLTRDEIIRAIDTADKFSKKHNSVNILLANSMPFCALPDHLSSYCEFCHFGASRFYIDVEGNVMMCGMSRIRIGNIISRTFQEIKSSSEVFMRHVLGDDVTPECSICNNFQRCRGGCRAAALAYTGNLCGADPYSFQ